MPRPLYFDTVNNQIEEMTDTDLIRLAYNCQVAYAAYLKGTSNNRGCIFPSGNSGDLTNIGSASDTSSTVQSSSVTKPGTETTSDDNAYPPFPGLGTVTNNTYNYQERKDPNVGAFGGLALPPDGHYDSYGYLRLVGAGNLQPEVQGHSGFSELLAVIDSQMQSNEVGTYRIASSTPTAGGAGTWSNEGTWFTDATYSVGSTTYNYYLKEYESLYESLADKVDISINKAEEKSIPNYYYLISLLADTNAISVAKLTQQSSQNVKQEESNPQAAPTVIAENPWK